MSAAVLVSSRRAEDLYAGWWSFIGALGAVPLVLVWDGGSGRAGRGRRTELIVQCQGFRGTLATNVIICLTHCCDATHSSTYLAHRVTDSSVKVGVW